MAWGGLVLDTAALNTWSDNLINDDNNDVNDENDKSDDDYNLIDNPADDQNVINDHFTFYEFPPYI